MELQETNKSSNHKEYWRVVDIVKFVMCIFIIAIHTNLCSFLPSSMEYWIEKALFRLAVPFFFLTTGFLLENKRSKCLDLEEIKKVFINYTKRLIRMLVIFEPISLAITIVKELHDKMPIWKIILLTIRRIIFYPTGALWYVQACIIGIWIIYLFYKMNLRRLIIPIGAVLYIFALLSNSYYFLIDKTYFGKAVDLYLLIANSARNGLFVGFFYLYIGMIAYRIYQLHCLSKRIIVMGLIVSYFLYLFEIFLLRKSLMKDDGSLFVVLPIVVSFLLLACVQHHSNTKNTGVILMRNLSTGMYLLHSPVLNIIKYIVVLSRQFFAPVLFVLTIIISAFICLLSYRSKNKFINTLLK